VLFVAAAYMWYRGCGTYFTVPELATFRFVTGPAAPRYDHPPAHPPTHHFDAAHRDRALLSEYSEIVDEHGLGQATKFVTPRELRVKLFKQARDKGILSCLKVIFACAACVVRAHDRAQADTSCRTRAS
jgi:hypothetical protein